MKRKPKAEFAQWTVEAGRVVTNGRVRFYLGGSSIKETSERLYDPCWLDRMAYKVADMLNATSDTGEYLV